MKSAVSITSNEQNITKEKIKEYLPRGTSHKVTDEVIELVHRMEEDTGIDQEYMEESFLSHLHVLKGMKVGLRQYANAIKYCNLKRSMPNEKAWKIVFPDRAEKAIGRGRDISIDVAIYNSSPLIVAIDTQMMVAEHIQYAPVFHEAIRREAQLMRGIDANGEQVSPHVQHLAASTLIEKLAPPKETKIDLRIGQSDEAKEAQERMFNEMRRVAEQQQKLLESGHNIEDIQKLHITMTNAEVEDADIEE